MLKGCSVNVSEIRNGNVTKFLSLKCVHIEDTKGFMPGEGVLPEKLGRGVWPASQNPYPIFDQNLGFFPTLFMT